MRYIVMKDSADKWCVCLMVDNPIAHPQSIHDCDSYEDAVKMCSELNAMLDGKAHCKAIDVNITSVPPELLKVLGAIGGFV